MIRRFFKLSLIFCLLIQTAWLYSADKYSISKKRWNRSSYVFDIGAVPKITVVIKMENWNKILLNFDENSRNEKEVSCDFIFEKNGVIETINEAGFRIRGNLSRRRPEGEKGELHNPDKPDYRHVHFRIDFNEYRKANFHTLTSLNLKWFKDDSTFVREIYCYDLFHRFGVFTAPRSSYCRLYLKFVEEEKPVYYGLYEMVEPVDKQFIKTRFNANKNSDNGDLWKCLWGANLRSPVGIGIEDPDGKKHRVNYDLKTNKKEFDRAKSALVEFIRNLNKLKGLNFAIWIEKNFDVDLFLKAQAVNVAVGMWDDYWANNGNNYYLYFDEKGKGYFIPYDYDNTLGTSLVVKNSGLQDPFNWGSQKAPLINKILSIEKYRYRYNLYLKKLIKKENDYFDADKSAARIKKWKDMIEPFLKNDLGVADVIEDKPAKWGNCAFYRLLSGNDSGLYPEANYFKTRIKTIKEASSAPRRSFGTGK